MTIDLEKLTKIGDWILSKATIATGIFAGLGALHMMALYALKLPFFHFPKETHGALDKVALYGGVLFGILAFTTLIVQQKKNAKQAAAIAAEQIRRNPAVPDTSVVPAVKKEIVRQTIDGEPPA